MYSNQTSVITKNIHNCHRINQPRSCTLLKMDTNNLMDTFHDDQQHLSTVSSALSSILPTSVNIPVNYIFNTKNSLDRLVPDFYNGHLINLKSKYDLRPGSLYDFGKGKRRPIPVPVENKDDA